MGRNQRRMKKNLIPMQDLKIKISYSFLSITVPTEKNISATMINIKDILFNNILFNNHLRKSIINISC